jgi:hypothetical protein
VAAVNIPPQEEAMAPAVRTLLLGIVAAGRRILPALAAEVNRLHPVSGPAHRQAAAAAVAAVLLYVAAL